MMSIVVDGAGEEGEKDRFTIRCGFVEEKNGKVEKSRDNLLEADKRRATIEL